MKTRPATQSDLARLREIEKQIIKRGDEFVPSVQGEFERGLEQGWLLVAVNDADDEVHGFVQFELSGEDACLLVALAVAPDCQGKGVGNLMLSNVIAKVTQEKNAKQISCVTSPKNYRMISLLLKAGFHGLELIRDYYGKGKDQYGSSFRLSQSEYTLQDRILIPVTSSDALAELMWSRSLHLVDIQETAQGRLVVLGLPVISDLVSLRQTEANTSVGQAAGVLAAVTFLVSVGFDRFQLSQNGGILMLLIFSVILSLGAIQIYANSTGNMARIGDGTFDKHMKWGNLLLDFGAHYPLVLILPALFAADPDTKLFNAIVLGGAVSLILVAYEISPFSIYHRYKFSWINFTLMALTCAVPLFSFVLVLKPDLQFGWLITVTFLLAGRFLWQAYGKHDELNRLVGKK